ALACLTTACGLIVSVSEYFNRIFPRISYKTYVIIFTLVSFILANQGLNSVITMSVPVLCILYPLAITSVFLILLARFILTKPISMLFIVAVFTIISILSMIHILGLFK